MERRYVETEKNKELKGRKKKRKRKKEDKKTPMKRRTVRKKREKTEKRKKERKEGIKVVKKEGKELSFLYSFLPRPNESFLCLNKRNNESEKKCIQCFVDIS